MADWRGVQEGLVSGYQVGKSTGGKLSGLGGIIAKVADRLRTQREAGEEQGRKINLLGIEGLIKGMIAPAEQEETGTTFDIPGMGTMKPVEQVKAVINPVTGQIEYTIPKKSVFQPKQTPEITKTTALNIISDPVKAEQLKMTYPDVYSLVESIAQGEDQKTIPFQPPKIAPTEERVNVISPTGQKGSIPKSQLEEALKAGYKKTIK